MFCRYCGHEQSDGNFCDRCGKPVYAPREAEERYPLVVNVPEKGNEVKEVKEDKVVLEKEASAETENVSAGKSDGEDNNDNDIDKDDRGDYESESENSSGVTDEDDVYADEDAEDSDEDEEYADDDEYYSDDRDGEEYANDDEYYSDDREGEEYADDDEYYSDDREGEEYTDDDEYYSDDREGEEYADDDEYYSDDQSGIYDDSGYYSNELASRYGDNSSRYDDSRVGGGYYQDRYYPDDRRGNAGRYNDRYYPDERSVGRGYQNDRYYPDERRVNSRAAAERFYNEGYYGEYDDRSYPRSYAPAGGEKRKKGKGSSSSSVVVMLVCMAICALGIFSIVVLLKLMGGDDRSSDSNSGFVTTPVTTTKRKPEVTTVTSSENAAETEETKKPEKPKNVEMISATELYDMSASDIKDIIGDDYQIFEDEENSEWGITSDTYFPNVIIRYPDAVGEDDVVEAFESGEEFYGLAVFEGGDLGDGVKVGDSYRDMITKVNSLGGIDVSADPEYGVAYSYVNDHKVALYFDGLDELEKISDRVKYDIVDGFNADTNCVCAFIEPFDDDEMIKSVVTANVVALRVAPYVDATCLMNVDSGDEIYISSKTPLVVNGDSWFEVTAYYFNGVRKHGFIHSAYVKPQ